MTRRRYAARIALTELEGVNNRVETAKRAVAGLLATNGPHAARIEAEVRHELQVIQGHLARVQDELKTLAERSGTS